MQNNLLPEAIRGAWLLITDKLADPTTPGGALRAGELADQAQLIRFGIDGEFQAFPIKDGQLADQPKRAGDYTFDGDFLILRAKSTDTFRVSVDAPWCWALEARKKRRRLVRGLLGSADITPLDPQEANEIDLLAARVKVKTPLSGEHPALYELQFEQASADPLRLATFSADPDAEFGELWLGLTPLVEGLKPNTWQKIITHAFLPGHRRQLDDFDRVAVEILGADTIRYIDL